MYPDVLKTTNSENTFVGKLVLKHVFQLTFVNVVEMDYCEYQLLYIALWTASTCNTYMFVIVDVQPALRMQMHKCVVHLCNKFLPTGY